MESLPPDQDLIVFDGVCVVCSGFARFIARHDRARRFLFVTAQSEQGRALYARYGLDPDLMETNIVIVCGRAHVRMQAFAAAMGALGWPWAACVPLGWVPRIISDPLYDLVARNRYRFGRQACPAPSAELKARLIA
ncbi:thiol-disulfide oxidoreductase DCC family protein [Xanthobacter sp.]|uniref:thiol-disulfide oxidoreductase DCC family protein n=1 Tax=Xanthobacter sp. TaxID=35809 RepID=UPI0025E0DE3D|nr:DCC1-like thiol-disulfide oxidoreductase family protein [Xanthobacter sp.]